MTRLRWPSGQASRPQGLKDNKPDGFRKDRAAIPRSAPQVLPCPVSASEILLDKALTVTEGDKTYDISVEEALRQRTFQDAGLQVGAWRCARWSSGSSGTRPGWQGRTAIVADPGTKPRRSRTMLMRLSCFSGSLRPIGTARIARSNRPPRRPMYPVKPTRSTTHSKQSE